MHTYKEAQEFLFENLPMFQRAGASAYKADLSNIKALLTKLDHPERGLKYVHIAGTNGKGSTSHALAAILIQAGYKVGLFTSPHLKHFSERIRVNGQPISEEQILHYVRSYRSLVSEISPSFFELTTAMAFEHFQAEKVDIAIMEVGMGGRLDSTNVIDPLLSIITQIDYDHQKFLGDTLEEITAEKAGIIKENTPVLTSVTPHSLQEVIKSISSNKKAPYYHSEQFYEISYQGYKDNAFSYLIQDNSSESSYELSSDLGGSYQANNLQTVLSAVELLKQNGFNINTETAVEALSKVNKLTGFSGRWQVLRHPDNVVKIIADTGHNISALEHIVGMLKQESYNRLHIVWGMVNDKDIMPILKLLPKEAKYYFTQANVPRALPSAELMKLAKTEGLEGNDYDTVEKAFDEAVKNASEDDLIFIGGSTFVVAEVPIIAS